MPWPKGKPRTAEHTAKRVATFLANGRKRRPSRIIDGEVHWLCPTCRLWLPSSGFYRTKRTWNGLGSQCKACHSEGVLRTRDKDRARDSSREYVGRARLRDPEKFRAREREASRHRPRGEKYRARTLLNNAVRDGRIAKPEACQACGAAARLTGHHADYSKPLEVQWLCYRCHGKVHRTAI